MHKDRMEIIKEEPLFVNEVESVRSDISRSDGGSLEKVEEEMRDLDEGSNVIIIKKEPLFKYEDHSMFSDNSQSDGYFLGNIKEEMHDLDVTIKGQYYDEHLRYLIDSDPQIQSALRPCSVVLKDCMKGKGGLASNSAESIGTPSSRNSRSAKKAAPSQNAARSYSRSLLAERDTRESYFGFRMPSHRGPITKIKEESFEEVALPAIKSDDFKVEESREYEELDLLKREFKWEDQSSEGENLIKVEVIAHADVSPDSKCPVKGEEVRLPKVFLSQSNTNISSSMEAGTSSDSMESTKSDKDFDSVYVTDEDFDLINVTESSPDTLESCTLDDLSYAEEDSLQVTSVTSSQNEAALPLNYSEGAGRAGDKNAKSQKNINHFNAERSPCSPSKHDRSLKGNQKSKRFKCHLCPWGFDNKAHLIRHQLVHSTETPFKCHLCNKTYKDTSSLKTHLVIHSNAKPFTCQHCTSGFTRKSCLKIHMRIHSNLKPYKCEHCKGDFRARGDLKMHLLHHFGERPLKCHHCSLGFFKNSHLQEHMRIHTGERPFKCHVCCMSFKRKAHVKHHMKTHYKSK